MCRKGNGDMDNNKVKPLGKKEFENDKKLEQKLIDVQEQLGCLRGILSDYIYMDSPSRSHVCLVKRSKKSFFGVLEKQINEVEQNIEEISKLICPKIYSDSHLASKVFEVKILYVDYFKCNTQVLIGSIKRQKEKILKNRNISLYKRNELLMGECIYLYEMTFDVSQFFDEMYCWKMARYEELVRENMIEQRQLLFSCQIRQKASKRKALCARDILGASQQIVSRYIYKDDISIVPVAIFQLRQAIEIRLLEILKIDRIQKKDGTPEKITANSFLELPDIDNNIVFPIEISNLKKIYTWTNMFVHLGVCGEYWLLEFAQNYLLDFILCNSVILKSYYDALPEKISEFTGFDIDRIILRRRACVDIIEDKKEFERVKEMIKNKGYTEYKKSEQDKIMKYMEMNNCM